MFNGNGWAILVTRKLGWFRGHQHQFHHCLRKFLIPLFIVLFILFDRAILVMANLTFHFLPLSEVSNDNFVTALNFPFKCWRQQGCVMNLMGIGFVNNFSSYFSTRIFWNFNQKLEFSHEFSVLLVATLPQSKY